ncbi:MAG: (Fe-S)-binding protein [Pseudomonadota bacterium]
MTAVIDRIAQSLQALESLLSACTRCGACQAVCPVFSRTGREADVARGKLALLDALAARLFETPDGVMERLERCLLCGTCAARCPAGVQLMEIFALARFIIKDVTGLSALQRVALRMILAAPKRFNRLLGVAARVQDFAGGERCGETTAIPVGPSRIRDRHFVPLAPVPFREMINTCDLRQAKKAGAFQPVVIFFTGCLLDKFFPHVARAAVATLTEAGVRLILPADQGCCGMPAVSMGDSKTLVHLLHHHVNMLSAQPFDYLVTACATCAAMIKTLWPRLSKTVATNLTADLTDIAKKTMEISQFLSQIGGISSKTPPAGSADITVTYHDPCHLKNAMGVTREPRQLIRANPRYHLVEMEGAGSCCGMGGTFNWRHYGLSSEIGEKKRDRILATGASVVATSCPACMMQLSDMLAKTMPRVKVKHVIELYSADCSSVFSCQPMDNRSIM